MTCSLSLSLLGGSDIQRGGLLPAVQQDLLAQILSHDAHTKSLSGAQVCVQLLPQRWVKYYSTVRIRDRHIIMEY